MSLGAKVGSFREDLRSLWEMLGKSGEVSQVSESLAEKPLRAQVQGFARPGFRFFFNCILSPFYFVSFSVSIGLGEDSCTGSGYCLWFRYLWQIWDPSMVCPSHFLSFNLPSSLGPVDVVVGFLFSPSSVFCGPWLSRLFGCIHAVSRSAQY